MLRLSWNALLAGGILLLPSFSYAAPDAGALHQDRRAQPGPSVEADPDVNLDIESSSSSAKPAESPGGVFVQGYTVHGNTLLSQAELEAVLQPFSQRMLSVAEIHDAAAALQQRYIDTGLFAAEVVIPPQMLEDPPVVALHVYEGRIADNGVYLVNSGERVKDSVIHRILVKNLATGTPLERAPIERTMLLIGDLPGVEVKGALLPGEVAGEALLQLETTDEPAINGDLYIDNFGDYYTGEMRVGGSLYFNSPTGLGDQLILDMVTSGEGSQYLYGEYSLPVGGNGLRLGASLDYLNYELGEEYEPFDVMGDAYEAALLARYPLIRARHHNLRFNTAVSSLRMHDEDNVIGESDRRVDKLTLGLHGDREFNLYRVAEFSYGLGVDVGRVDILGDDNYLAFDRATSDTEGNFARFNYHVAWLQHLGGAWSSFLMINGQVANGNLDTSQKLYLGGPYDVAGYPVSEASGDEGTQLHIDIRRDFADVLFHSDTQVSLFYSQGWLTLFNDTWPGWEGGNPQIENRFSLKTVGLSSHSTWRSRYQLQLIVGRQLGDNPGSDPLTGEDTDRSDSDYRAWAQLAYFF